MAEAQGSSSKKIFFNLILIEETPVKIPFEGLQDLKKKAYSRHKTK